MHSPHILRRSGRTISRAEESLMLRTQRNHNSLRSMTHHIEMDSIKSAHLSFSTPSLPHSILSLLLILIFYCSLFLFLSFLSTTSTQQFSQTSTPGSTGLSSILIAYDALLYSYRLPPPLRWKTLVEHSILHSGATSKTGMVACSLFAFTIDFLPLSYSSSTPPFLFLFLFLFFIQLRCSLWLRRSESKQLHQP